VCREAWSASLLVALPVPPMLPILIFHAVVGVGVLLAGARLGRWAFAVGAAAPATSLGWFLVHGADIVDGHPATGSLAWAPTLGLELDTRVDAFSLTMGLLVAGIGVLVFVYAWRYLADSPAASRTAGLLTVFAGAMTTIVVADNVFLLFLGWELTSVTSYLLIGGDGRRAEGRAAARHALLITAAGGLAMLGGLVLLGSEAGTFRLSEILADAPSGTAVSVALLLVLAGAATKSAQFPFHAWLAGAMVAPTPVSAYLHSATMVKAGVYLVARLAPTFADHGAFGPVAVTLGLVTMVVGAWRALVPTDLKQVLAYSTVSQLGFLFALFGLGHPAATAAGVAVLVAHALLKATLFLVVGTVDHVAGTRDLARLPPLVGRRWKVAVGFAAIAAASMAAVPPLAGFVAKEAAYAALVHGSTLDRLVLAVMVAGSIGTVAYSLRLVVGLVRPASVVDDHRSDAPAVHAPTAGFLVPAVPLVILTVALGLVPSWWASLAGPAGESLDAAAHPHLTLWPGLGAPLALSAITLAAGFGLFLARSTVGRVVRATLPASDRVTPFERAIAALLTLARVTSATVQRGSLPFAAGVALAVAAVASISALLTGPWGRGEVPVVGPVVNLPVAALLIVAGVGCTLATRRYVAAILLGGVGYAMALLFVVHGAPDLALTQFGVETISVVVFLVVLRHLPDRFEDRPPMASRSVRLAIAALVGTFVLLFSLAAAGVRPERTVAREMVERALPEGHGANVINVILVDIRGLDTLGEITVLVAASVGVASLAVARTRSGRRT
jgi:multicomponent Na+:H+ antiporter subunit A